MKRPILHFALRHALPLALACALAAAPATHAWTWGTTNRTWNLGWFNSSAPALDTNGTVYQAGQINTGSAYLFSLAPDGSTNWLVPLWGNRVCNGTTLGEDGTIYVGSYSSAVFTVGRLYAISPTGTVDRIWYTGNWIGGSPALAADGTPYQPCADSRINAFNSNGTTNWSLNLLGWLEASPAVGWDGTIYQPRLYPSVPAPTNLLIAISPTGAVVQTWAVSNWLYSTPSIGTDGTIYVGCMSSNMFAFNATGGVRWSTAVGGWIRGAASIGTNGLVYAGCEDGRLYAFDAQSGTVTRTWQTTGPIRSTPAIAADGTIYIGSDDTYFYGFHPDGGTSVLWKTGAEIRSSPAIGPDGTIYVSSGDGFLYAFTGTSPLADSAWPKFKHDLRNTGLQPPPPAAGLTASDGRYPEHVGLSWSMTTNATAYEIWRGTNAALELASVLARLSPTNSFDDTNVVRGVVHYYWIRAANNAGAQGFSNGDDGFARALRGIVVGVW